MSQEELLINLGIIVNLVLLEGLLSFDNALALAALVNKRLSDPKDRKRALTWGIWGAYVFRTLMIFVGVTLMQYPWIRIGAGAYLIWIAFAELVLKRHDGSDHPEDTKLARMGFLGLSPLWSTIVAVELMDIMFSIDSIGVALALSSNTWVLITGAFLGILMMRVAAQFFIVLIQKFPILVKTAFVLVALAGINIILDAHGVPIPFTGGRTFTIGLALEEKYFLSLLFSIFIGSMAFDWARQRAALRRS